MIRPKDAGRIEEVIEEIAGLGEHVGQLAIKLFEKDADAAAALATGKVDAYFSDDPPVGYYVKSTDGRFEVAADKIQSAPYGIATRKGDALGPAMSESVDALYSSGAMTAILTKWGLSAFAFGK